MKDKNSARKKAIKGLKSVMKKDILEGLPEKMKGKMSVKVMSDSPEGLKEGLEKAEDVLEGGEKSGLGDMLKDAFSKRTKKTKKED